ncbi:MAG: Spx/MgsR family RNA polymerase-binding regulatory protein [Chitinophagaceae bacterium]|nr:Spx/MgsR family RNA polymerase-binding regulatory protein [Chitinophagaceae bacterium]
MVYGIANCDTVKKTKDWLKSHKVPFDFYDYKVNPVSREKLTGWCKELGWESILNKKSATWRSLSPEEQKKVTGQPQAIRLMMRNNSIIKRPVIEKGSLLIVGYDETEFANALK